LDVLWSLLWIIILFSAMSPAVHQHYLQAARQTLIRAWRRKAFSFNYLDSQARKRGSVGLPIARYITMEDSEAVLTAIRSTPPDTPIDLVLHTPGGLVLAAEQIARHSICTPQRLQ